jgi:hypothetical protein
MAVSDDIQTAIVTTWLQDAAAGGLKTLINDGPKAGAIPAPTPNPYCAIVVKQERQPEYSSGGFGWHFQRVTLTVFAKKADVVTITDRIEAVFANATNVGPKTLTVPNSTHIFTQQVGVPKMEAEKSRKDADEIWKGIVEYLVQVSRTSP